MSTFSNITKTTVSTFSNLVKRIKSYLLVEDGFHLLLEDGGAILIDRGVEYSDTTKNTATITNITKS